MELPYSEELNIGHLSKLFGKTTNCYKFFWFQAILRKLDGIQERVHQDIWEKTIPMKMEFL